jgi:hypothetical protein
MDQLSALRGDIPARNDARYAQSTAKAASVPAAPANSGLIADTLLFPNSIAQFKLARSALLAISPEIFFWR